MTYSRPNFLFIADQCCGSFSEWDQQLPNPFLNWNWEEVDRLVPGIPYFDGNMEFCSDLSDALCGF